MCHGKGTVEIFSLVAYSINIPRASFTVVACGLALALQTPCFHENLGELCPCSAVSIYTRGKFLFT